MCGVSKDNAGCYDINTAFCLARAESYDSAGGRRVGGEEPNGPVHRDIWISRQIIIEIMEVPCDSSSACSRSRISTRMHSATGFLPADIAIVCLANL